MRRVIGIVLCPLALLLVGAVALGHNAFGRGGHRSPEKPAATGLSADATSAPSTIVDGGPIVLPLDAYRLTQDEHSLVRRALLILATRCMRARGFTDITLPTSVVGGAPDSLGHSRRYGVTDADAARRYGYHLPPNTDSERNSAELDRWLSKQAASELDAVYGTDDESGCTESAQKELGHDRLAASFGWFTDLDFKSLEQSERDRRVIAAIHDWRSCMRREGWTYAGPYDATGDRRWNLDSPAIPTQEISAAAADVGCKRKTRLVETWVTVETEIQQDYIRRNSHELARLTEARRALLLNAKRIA